MRTLDFPGRDPLADELEAALNGAGAGPEADAWRALRDDVRALASPIDPDFERRLRERMGDPDSARKRAGRRRSAGRGHRRSARARRWVRDPRLLGGAAGALAAVAVGIVIAGPFSSGRNAASTIPEASGPTPLSEASPTEAHSKAPQAAGPRAGATAAGGAAAGATPPASAGLEQLSGSNGRLQQLSASIVLATAPGEVQSVADGVSRLAAREGGFVQRSQVNVQSGGGEATLQLSIPSARLSAALAALGRLAPVRAESQALQDITHSYESAKRRLADAVGARAALLRALAHATTQAQIESLRRQLSLASGAIDRARSNLQAIARSARSSSLEVSVLGDGHSAGGGLTLDRGVHDAGHVLTVALIVVLIGLAALVPLLLVLAALLLAARRGRRVLRERALEGP